jgi:hypothetical protein
LLKRPEPSSPVREVYSRMNSDSRDDDEEAEDRPVTSDLKWNRVRFIHHIHILHSIPMVFSIIESGY